LGVAPVLGVTGGFVTGGFNVGEPPPGFTPVPPPMFGGFTVVFGGTKGGVPIFGLLTIDVIGGLTTGDLSTGETGGLTTGGLGVPGGFTTGEIGGLTSGVFLLPVILSITAFVVAPKAAPVKAVPNLLVVPVDFLTTGFAVGVTCVLLAGVVGLLLMAGFAAVIFDVIDGFAVVVAGFEPLVPVLVRLVRGAVAPEVVDVTGRDAPPPRDGCLPTPPKEGDPSP
jgi:hypothetical protein